MIDTNKISKQVKAYEITFLVENMLRVSMHNVMVKKVGVNYFNEQVFPEYECRKVLGQNKINVVNVAKSRRGLEKPYNILRDYDFHFYWYLDFSILISLLDTFWDKYFHEILKSAKNRIKDELMHRLEIIMPIRNAIAHNRYISNIDLADLESLLAVLQASLNVDYLRNVEDLALNPHEEIINNCLDILNNMDLAIKAGKYVDKPFLLDLRSSFSAVISLTENKTQIHDLENIINLVEKYNRLPRKPGRIGEIASFKQATQLEGKISAMIKSIGEYI